MTEIRAEIRPCPVRRCRGRIFDVQIIRARGAPIEATVDAKPFTWEQGARIKLIPSEHAGDGKQLAEKLTASQVHKAFAVTGLYVPHAEVCGGAQKKKATPASRKKAGHA